MSIFKSFLFSAFITYILNVSVAYAMEEEEAREIYEKAKANPIVKRAHEAGVARRQEESCQLKLLRSAVMQDESMDLERLQAKVISGFEEDVKIFRALNAKLTGRTDIRFQVLKNKMQLISEQALVLAKSKTFFDIIQGDQLPYGYSIEPPGFNCFPNETHIYSNGGRGNSLKCILLKVWSIQNQGKSLQYLPFDFESCPFLHVNALPKGITVEGSYGFCDEQTPNGFISVHNGYAFGAHRGEKRYPRGRLWGPEDCSSLVAKSLRSSCIFTTQEMVKVYQIRKGFQFRDYCDKEQDLVWKWRTEAPKISDEPYVIETAKVVSPYTIPDDHTQIPAGLIHCEAVYQKANVTDHNILTGNAGHTGIFLGTIKTAEGIKALTIAAARDLESKGKEKEFIYGVEERPLYSSVSKERVVLFFEGKEKK